MGEEERMGPVEKIEEKQLLPKNVICPAYFDQLQYKARCGAKIVKKAPVVLQYEELGPMVHDIFHRVKEIPRKEWRKFGFGGPTNPEWIEPIYVYVCERGRHHWVRPWWWADVPVVPLREIYKLKEKAVWPWEKEASEKAIKEYEEKWKKEVE
ncbi:hypothetical protein [Candidatus Alkanophaga liquidiphilum]|nr:hypothetical protein [Candidatus Alkanophaga liquidiphilum]